MTSAASRSRSWKAQESHLEFAAEQEAWFRDNPIAALYVEKNGGYSDLPGVDVWDIERDARLYEGPHPVVAHPPCNRWSVLAGMIETRYGYKRGDDGGCFAAALNAVRTYGGVLEQPAHSYAFQHFCLPIPGRGGGWTSALGDPGWSCWVDQGWYGHKLKKPTWLYAVGCELPKLHWGRGPGVILPRRAAIDGVRVLFVLSEQQRKALTIPTPPAFRDLLLGMARSVDLDFFRESGADLQVADLQLVSGGERTGRTFQANLEAGENVVGDLVGVPRVAVKRLDVEVDQDGAGHGSSLGDGDSATLPPSGADGGGDGDTFLPSSAPVDVEVKP